jgi:predicted O-methyltransferase YrrM
MATRTEAIAEASKIDGWLAPDELGDLYDHAQESLGPIVSIGAYQGRSTLALALGAKSGTRQPVYAIDPLVGISEDVRRFAANLSPMEEVVRNNLSANGINGEVTIITRPSQEIHTEIPDEIGVLFLDGQPGDARRDMELYLPKVKMGGVVVVHDVEQNVPEVVEAFDEHIFHRTQFWRMLGRVNRSVAARRVESKTHSICLMCQGSAWKWDVMQGVYLSAFNHNVRPINQSMQEMLASALTGFEAGNISHMAFLSSDFSTQPGWLDVMMDEMDARDADLISVAAPLEEGNGVLSCGWGDPEVPLGLFRRFTMREVYNLPPTFNVRQTEYPDKFLLHGNACWVADLRKDVFRAVDPANGLKASFLNHSWVFKEGMMWYAGEEMPSWYWSRRLAELGAKTLITRKILLKRQITKEISNGEAWGVEKDFASRHIWEK